MIAAAIVAGAAYLIHKGIDMGIDAVTGLLTENTDAGDALEECVTGDQSGALAGAAEEVVEEAAEKANPGLSLDKKNDKWIEAQTGVSAHEIKKDVVGRTRISRYDLYVDKNTGDVYVVAKGGKGEAQETGYNVR